MAPTKQTKKTPTTPTKEDGPKAVAGSCDAGVQAELPGDRMSLEIGQLVVQLYARLTAATGGAQQGAPVPLMLQLAQQAGATKLKEGEAPSEANDWGGCYGAGLDTPADLLAAGDQKKKKFKPWAKGRPWEHNSWARSSSLVVRATGDNLPAAAKVGAGTACSVEEGGKKLAIVVLGCRCKEKGLQGADVIAHHEALAAWRWASGNGARLWSAPPPCLAKALGFEKWGAFLKATSDAGSDAYASEAGEKLRSTLLSCYMNPPKKGQQADAVKDAWRKIAAGPQKRKREESDDDAPKQTPKRVKREQSPETFSDDSI